MRAGRSGTKSIFAQQSKCWKLSATYARTAVKLAPRLRHTHKHLKIVKHHIKCTQRETKAFRFSQYGAAPRTSHVRWPDLRARIARFPGKIPTAVPRRNAIFWRREREVKLRFICALKLKTVLSCANAPPKAAPASGFPDTPSRGYDWAIKHGDGGERPLPTFPAFSLKFYGARRWLRVAIAKLIYSRSEIEP